MQSFDDQIRDKFSGFESEVPAHIWENIAKRGKRRRGFFWFNLNGGIGLLMISVALLGGANLLYKQLDTKKARTLNAVKFSTNNSSRTSKKTVAADQTEQTSNPASAIENTQSSGTTVINNPENTVTDFERNNNSAVNEGSAISVVVNVAKIKIGAPNTGKTNLSNHFVAYSTADEEVNKSTEQTQRIEFLSPLNYLPASAKAKAYSPFLLIPAFNRPSIPCPEKDAAGNKKYIEVFAGPDYVFRSFSDTGNSTYLAKRKETTAYSFAFSTGARYTRVFSNGTSIRAGLNFSQTIEKFSQVVGNYTHTEYTVINGTDTIGSYIVSGKLFRTNYNKYNTIDIPVSIGYEIGNGKWHANINAGAMINLYSWQKGLVIDTAYRAVSITTGDSPTPYQFKSNIGLGFLGSVSLYYKLNDHLHLMAEPYFRYNLSASNKEEEITLKQKFHTTGLRVGLRFDLR